MWAPFWYESIMWALSYGRVELCGALESLKLPFLGQFSLAPRFRFLTVHGCIGFHAPDGRASLQPLRRIVSELSCFHGVLKTRRQTNRRFPRAP
jgi:hypothetical protein